MKQALGVRAALESSGLDHGPISVHDKMKAMGLDEVLLITDEIDRNLALSSRNLANVEVIAARNANPVALVRSPAVVLTRKAMARLEEMLA